MSDREATEHKEWKTSFHLAAAGVYDPEKQLNDAGIIELKSKLKDNHQLIGRVATHIVMKLRDDDHQLNVAEALTEEETPAPFIGQYGEFETSHEYARWISVTAIDWAFLTQRLVNLPGAEWIEGATPPATFAEALIELDAIHKGDDIDG